MRNIPPIIYDLIFAGLLVPVALLGFAWMIYAL